MKVLHYVSKFSPLSQTFIYDYITQLERTGVENHVVTEERMNEDSRSFPKVTVVERPSIWDPQRLWYRVLEAVGGRQRHTSGWPQHRRKLGEVVQRLRPDVIHAHFGTAGVRIGPVAFDQGVPLIVSFHGFDAFKLCDKSPWRQEYSNLFKQATYLTAVSRLMANHLTAMGAPEEKMKVIHVGKRMKEYSYSPTSPPIEKWVSVGRLVEKKGHKDCIEAFGKVVEEKDGVDLEVIGGGERDQKLRCLVEELGLEERIRLLGRRSHEEVKSRMKDADAFVLCSKQARDGNREGIPTVLMEAQAMGLPVVATRHSGIPEVIPEPHYDLLASEGDVEAIAEGMRRLLGRSAEELRSMAERGREKMEREFNLEKEASRLKNLYQSAC